jgi:molybdenum cofactor synthesis domain-containing protein
VEQPTAAIIIIGNEILTGKTEDKNARFLIEELYKLGVALRRIEVIPDDADEIARTVRACSPQFQYIFTSGGVGPTHDDVTVSGVAEAFGRQVVRHQELAAIIRGRFGKDADEAYMRMADTPEGSELIKGTGLRWPVLVVENVYVLPGVPEIFRSKFTAIRDRFRSTPMFGTAIFTREDEFQIASRLNRFATARPEILIGSYPKYESSDYSVKITIEGHNSEAVAAAHKELLELLDAEFIVRTEDSC